MNKSPSRIKPKIGYEQCGFVEDIGKKMVFVAFLSDCQTNCFI